MTKDKFITKSGFLSRLNAFFPKAIVSLMPISFFVLISDEQSVGILELRIAISDVLILLGFLLLLIKLIFHWGQIKVKLPEQPFSLFLIALVLSVVNVGSILSFIKELVQFSVAFYIWYFLLINNTSSLKAAKKLVCLIVFTACAIVPLAFYQYYIHGQDPYFIRGTFANRNMYGVYVAAITPLFVPFFFESVNKWKKVAWFFIIACALSTLLAPGHFLAACTGILMTLYLKRRRSLMVMLPGLAFFITVWLYISPSPTITEFRKFISVNEQSDITQSIQRVWGYNSATSKGGFFDFGSSGYRLRLASDLCLPPETTHETKLVINIDDKKVLKQYYAEWIAAINLLKRFPFTGCGLGNYQGNIGSYYGNLPKNNTAEPNCRNGYMVFSASAGLFGLFTFLFLFLSFGAKLYKIILASPDSRHYHFRIGLLGSMLSILIANFFTPVFNAQVSTLVVLILYLINKFSEDQDE